MKPIPGMTTEPYGLPLMAPAWLGCLLWAASEPNCAAQFTTDTGHNIAALRSTGINALIDKATGYDRSVLVAFADWVTLNLWGEEGDDAVDTELETHASN